LNTIGDVPLRWYEDMDHIGYDLLGEPIRKPEQEDVIDEFIQMNETPQGWHVLSIFFYIFLYSSANPLV